MIAIFYYNIPRHKGQYGTAVAVYNSKEDYINGEMWIKYFTTYRYNNTNEGNTCDTDKQVEYLKRKVLKYFPNIIF